MKLGARGLALNLYVELEIPELTNLSLAEIKVEKYLSQGDSVRKRERVLMMGERNPDHYNQLNIGHFWHLGFWTPDVQNIY